MSGMKVKAAILCNHTKNVERVFAQGRLEKLKELTELLPGVVTHSGMQEKADELQDVEVIFSTWGMSPLSLEEFDLLPKVRAVFHAGGSVKGFAEGFLERNIIVVSSWTANAVPVAEFTLAQILLSTKGYFRNTQACRTHHGRSSNPYRGRGNFGATVALLGCGQIARKLIELLKPFNLNVVVVDPYLTESDATQLGVEKITLEEAFRQADVVSNHLPNLPDIRGILTGSYFASMRENATFINTGRGAQVVESELASVLEKRPDLTALLDVTDPEPPLADSPFYRLSNVHISNHLAGSIGDEVVRMADYAISEFQAWSRGEPLRYAVNKEMLKIMA